MRKTLLAASIVTLATLGACSGEGGSGGGTVIIGTLNDPDALLPPLAGSVSGRIASELLFDRLAELGPTLDVANDSAYQPRLARRWSWSADSLAISFELDPMAKWHDGTTVMAPDVQAGLRAIRDTLNASPFLADVASIDSISAPDDKTVTFHFSRRDLEQFRIATTVFPLPAHLVDTVAPGTLRASAFAKAPVGSGRFRFDSWEPRVQLVVRAAAGHYRGRPGLDRVALSPAADPPSGLGRLWAGETDAWEPLTPPDLAEAAKHPGVRVMSGPGYDYGFLAFNLRDKASPARAHPIFGERELRRALTMAIDRDALRRAILDTLALVSHGPFTRAQATADTTITGIPFDRARAAAILDSLGWRARGAGTRAKGGRALAFEIVVPSTSAVRNRAAILLQEQLKEVGVAVTVRSMEFGAFRADLAAGKFDATINAMRTTPSPTGIRSSWGSERIAPGWGQNIGHYDNAEFDDAVTKGLGALDRATRARELRRAYQVIVDDAPAVWLYEVRNYAGVHDRLVIPSWRTDAWWLTLGDWSVDPAKRMPRDAAPAAP